MTSWKKYVLVAVILAVAGFGYIKSSHRNIPADLRDSVADNGEFDTSLPVFDKDSGNIPEPKAVVLEGFSKGHVAGDGPSAGVPTKPLKWISINGGKFAMGTVSGEKDFENAKPVHEVDVKNFEMSETDVTVEQYTECVDKGMCTSPETGSGCNWGVKGRKFHPVNCVSWDQATQYARFIREQPGFEGARLPSESEWEYAAKSGGKKQKYPWGNDDATCSRAVMYGRGNRAIDYLEGALGRDDRPGCGTSGTMPVCSKPKGNAKVSGGELCDMSGNVYQWVQDKYQNSYNGAPDNGSALEAAPGPFRVVRGGSFLNIDARGLRVDLRNIFEPGHSDRNVGFRLARSSR
jgi:formylglycine-generating enzyme required for sulfatase activity